MPDTAIEFWKSLDQLVASSRIVIDRPKGTSHPRYPEMIYPVDYGYLEGTKAMDGGGLDIWIGSSSGTHLDAVVLTVDLFKRDAEIKLLLGCSEEDTQIILDFLNHLSMRATLVRRQCEDLSQ